MNITVERQSNCEAKLSVEVPAEPVTEERKRIVRAFSSQARIPGFRPGKIPRTVIEKRFAEQIQTELEARIVRQALQEAAEKEDLRIINAKDPEDTIFHPDGSLTFSAHLTLSPSFDLPEYKGIELRIPNRVVGDEDVRRELDNLRNRFADYTDVTDRGVQAGDFAVIDYGAELDGKPLDEAIGQPLGYLSGGEDHWLKMEDGAFLPGFSLALEGARPDEQRDFSLPVPEDFAVEELRGVELAFHVTIKGVKAQILPELDDALARQILPDSDLQGLKDIIRGNLERHLTQQLQEFKINQLLERLHHGLSFDLPPDLVTAETQGQADEMVERGMGSGMSEDEIEARQEEIFAIAGQRAQMNLRTDFILQRIAEAEKITVTREELAQRVTALANRAKKKLKPFAKELQKTGRLNSIQHSMLLSKTIDFLLDHAKVEITDEFDAAEPATDAEPAEGDGPAESSAPDQPYNPSLPHD